MRYSRRCLATLWSWFHSNNDLEKDWSWDLNSRTRTEGKGNEAGSFYAFKRWSTDRFLSHCPRWIKAGHGASRTSDWIPKEIRLLVLLSAFFEWKKGTSPCWTCRAKNRCKTLMHFEKCPKVHLISSYKSKTLDLFQQPIWTISCLSQSSRKKAQTFQTLTESLPPVLGDVWSRIGAESFDSGDWEDKQKKNTKNYLRY